MRADPAWRNYTPACLTPPGRCDPAFYRSAQWLNGFFIAMTGALAFVAAWLIFGHAAPAWIAAGHLWLNGAAYGERGELLSDFMAMSLVALLMLLLTVAWRSQRPLAWIGSALVLAALTLTKAIYLYLLPVALVAGVVAVFRAQRKARAAAMLLLFLIAYGLPVGAWMERNDALGGGYTITVGRTADVLAFREAYAEMTPMQALAAAIYWTRGFGDDLARRLFPEQVWRPLQIDNPNGIYRRAQRRGPERVMRLMHEQGLTAPQAERRATRDFAAELMRNVGGYILSLPPLFLRGLWVDEFIVLSFPALLWLTLRALRRRQWNILAVLAVGWYPLLFYPLINLNTPRYQLAALPCLALATGGMVYLLRHRGAALWRQWRGMALKT